MKLKLNDEFKKKITAMAIQAYVQKRFQKLVEERMLEIEQELMDTDEEFTADDLIQKYMGVAIAVPQPTLLIPKH